MTVNLSGENDNLDGWSVAKETGHKGQEVLVSKGRNKGLLEFCTVQFVSVGRVYCQPIKGVVFIILPRHACISFECRERADESAH